MKTRIYLKDWFLNAGIIGFLRILEHNGDQFAKKQENYIEFDTENLRNFHQYYFNYFFYTYNVGKKTEERIINSFQKIKDNIEKNVEDKQEIKQKEDKIKTEKKYIKLVIKSILDKIQKINLDIYQNMLEAYNEIDVIKQKEDIEKFEIIQKTLINGINEEKVNKRITMNLFKSILSKNYFGQPSFLNVVKTNLSYEEQQDIMYKDYISNVIETAFLQEVLESKYTVKELKSLLEEKRNGQFLTKEIEKIYDSISNKYIEKEKTLDKIQEYLKNTVFSTCYMCEQEALTNNYSESHFVPLAISSDNMKNFFWNQNAKFPVCDICKLLLFCIPAGVTNILKTIKENKDGKVIYKEKQVLCFVNYDTDVITLEKTNNNFRNNSKLGKNTYNPYSDMILNIVKQDKKISQWQLQNIFVVEFETEYLAFSRMEYFHINRKVAIFLKEYANQTLNLINDYKYKLEIMDYILKNKDIKYIISERMRQDIKEKNPYSYYHYLAIKVRLTLNLLKKEEEGVEENIKKSNAKVAVLYNLGTEIHKELKEESKLDGYVYKMLNSIKTGDKKQFMDTVIRIHMMVGKDISPIFLEIMKESNFDFETVGHSFLAGLISNKYEKNEEVKKDGE